MAGKRICPDCGREWSENVIFCMGCGARTIEKTDEVTIVKKDFDPKEQESKETGEKLPDIEELILAYIRKVLVDKETSKVFIERVRALVNEK